MPHMAHIGTLYLIYYRSDVKRRAIENDDVLVGCEGACWWVLLKVLCVLCVNRLSQ